MATIVQSYGPIYGEPVNGTVSGRPNGSIAIPADNQIAITLADNTTISTVYDGEEDAYFIKFSNLFTISAISQDPGNYIRLVLYKSDKSTSVFSGNNYPGNFKIESDEIGWIEDPSELPTGTYYLRAMLVTSFNTVIVSSEFKEVVKE